MEKRLLFLIISFFGVAFSQDFQSWTGSTGFYNYPSLTAYPVQYNGSICAAGTNKTGYQSFTISVTAQNANRIWTIAAIVEKNHMGYAQIQIYNGAYNKSSPCTNLMGYSLSAASGRDGGSPHINYPIVFPTAGTYTVVITSSDANSVGLFVIRALVSNYTSVIGVSNNWWFYPDVDDDLNPDLLCNTTGGKAAYQFQQFSVRTNNYYDINFYFINDSISNPDLVATLYEGTAIPFLGTGTYASPADSCTGSTYVVTEYDTTTAVKLQRGAGGVFPRIWLRSNINYTLVFSTRNESHFGTFGTSITATVYDTIDNANLTRWTSPTWPYTNDSFCEANSIPRPWKSYLIFLLNPIVLIDTGPVPVGFDTITFVYQGFNIGSFDQYETPLTCSFINPLVASADTGDIQAIAFPTLAQAQYSIVVTPYSYAFPGRPIFSLFIWTGPYLGPLAPVTTGALTSSPLSTGTPFTTSPTTAAIPSTTGTIFCVSQTDCDSVCGSGNVQSCGCDQNDNPVIQCFQRQGSSESGGNGGTSSLAFGIPIAIGLAIIIGFIILALVLRSSRRRGYNAPSTHESINSEDLDRHLEMRPLEK